VKKYLTRIVAVAALAAGATASLVGGSQVLAVGSTTNNLNTLKISPVRSDITVAPGTSRKVTMKVTNITKAPMTVRPIENDFVAGDEKGTPALILDEDKYAPTHSLKRFMAPLKDVTIPAGETKEIPLMITVPADAKAGGYYGAVRFAPVANDGSKSVNLNASAASIVLLTVPGDLVEKLNLTNFDIKKDDKPVSGFVSNPDNLSLALRFENKGSVQAAPFGQIYVKEGDKVVYTYDFNQGDPRDMVLPDSARRWDVPLDKLGKFGKYTIGATFTYGKENKSIEISKTIWVIPTAYIIGAIVGLLVLIGLIVGIWYFLRHYKRRVLRKHGGGFRL
jgi:hypothetical protein